MSAVGLVFLVASGLFYMVSAGFYLAGLASSDDHHEKTGFLCIRIGFAAATGYLIAEAAVHGLDFPILNFAHVLAFFGWALAFLYFVPSRPQTKSFGLLLAPILFLLHLFAILKIGDPAYALKVHVYFALHIIFAFFAYAGFTLSFTAALLYLIQHRELKLRHPGAFYHKLPNLETLDYLTYQPIVFGVVLLVAAVAVGMAWSHDVYGQIWLSDPKTFLTFITIGLYGFLISLRYATAMRKSRLALLCIAIYVFLILGFVGGRHINSKHTTLTNSETEVSYEGRS